jgi:hypothetical protein
MKSYNTFYYLLTVLLIMGAFASMAQNSYGIQILSGVCIAFGLIFLFQFIKQLQNKDHKDISLLIEFSALFLLSFIFAFRIFFINVPFIEWVFGLAGIALALVYLKKMIFSFKLYESKNKLLAILVFAFHLSIMLFITSLITVPFAPRFAELAGAAAVILIIGFLIAGLLKRKFSVDGEKISAFAVIGSFKDRSVLLLSLFIIFSLYLGFTSTGILPKLYSDEYPQAYFELVNKSETGNEKAVNGKYKYEEFKKMYDEFVSRNIKNDKK